MVARVVDQRGFDAISCNRCGGCCEELSIGGGPGPLDMIASIPRMARSFSLWFGELVPLHQRDDGVWLYRCPRFARDADGLGVCTIYETRPPICSEFPYGRPFTAHGECAWNVEILEYEIVEGVLWP